jgi:hypothetical protein
MGDGDVSGFAGIMRNGGWNNYRSAYAATPRWRRLSRERFSALDGLLCAFIEYSLKVFLHHGGLCFTSNKPCSQ